MRRRGQLIARWQVVVLAATCGAAWGVAARIWMRLVSSDPEFTWSGSLFIVGAATIPGVAMGIVLTERGRWAILGRISVVPLCLGPGLVMVPTLVLGAMGIARRHRQPRIAILLAVLAVVAAVGIVGSVLAEELTPARVVVGVASFLVVMAWLAAMLAVSMSPGRSPSNQPSTSGTIALASATHSTLAPARETPSNRN